MKSGAHLIVVDAFNKFELPAVVLPGGRCRFGARFAIGICGSGDCAGTALDVRQALHYKEYNE